MGDVMHVLKQANSPFPHYRDRSNKVVNNWLIFLKSFFHFLFSSKSTSSNQLQFRTGRSNWSNALHDDDLIIDVYALFFYGEKF